MSIGINKTSKLPKSPLDVPSRPVVADYDERRYNSTRAFAKKNFGYIKVGEP